MLSNFKLPDTDVRLVRFGEAVYKIKLRYRPTKIHNETAEETTTFWKNPQIQCDMEKVVRYVLYKKNEEDLEPIRTDHFVVYPYRKAWTNAHKLKFYKDNVRLKTCSHLFLLYIERLAPQTSQRSTPACSQEQNMETGRKSQTSTPSTAFGTPYGNAGGISPSTCGFTGGITGGTSPPPSKKKRYLIGVDDEKMGSQDSFKSFKGMKLSDDEKEEQEQGEEGEPGVVYNMFNLLMTPAKAIRKFWK